MRNLVSVIIPFFNRQESLKRAIFSVLNQTYKDKEIILINDGSTEPITDILRMVSQYKEIHLYSNKKNLGPSLSRNKGINIAKGRFIAFLDSDDEWLNFKLSYQIKYMLEEKLSFTYTSYLKNHIENNKITLVKANNHPSYLLNTFKCNIATPTVVIEKKITRGIEFPSKIKYGEDIIYWSRLYKKTKIHGLNIPTALINVKKSSSSNNLSIQKEGFSNINKYLFKNNFILSLIHKIYYNIILITKSLILIIENKFR